MSDAILISILTVISYLISYMYQVGYYNHFNLPTFLIEINIVNTLSSIVPVTLLLFALYTVYHVGINTITEDTHANIAQLINKYTLFTVYLLMLWITIEEKEKGKEVMYTFMFIAMVMLVKDFILPLISEKKESSYKEKIISSRKNKQKHDNTGYGLEESAKRNVVLKYAFVLFKIVSILYLLLIFSENTGNYVARTKTDFVTLDTNKVILGVYDNHFIVSNVNLKKKTIQPTFHLVPKQTDAEYLKTTVGPLKLKE